MLDDIDNLTAGIIVLLSVATFSIVLKRIIMYNIQLWTKPFYTSFLKTFDGFFISVFLISVILQSSLFFFCQEWKMLIKNYYEFRENSWINILVSNPIAFIFLLSCVVAFIHSFDTSDVELVETQLVKNSIGSMWAHMAYDAYYQVLFSEWYEYIHDYLESGRHLDCTNMIIICPLSCNINGTLSERFARIEVIGDFADTECDQGANINRHYRNPVYRVGEAGNTFNLIAQFASSLGTLWQVKDSMPLHKWLYHRETFIFTLKRLLKDCPCTILEYDDTDEHHQEPLDSFLISRLNLRR